MENNVFENLEGIRQPLRERNDHLQGGRVAEKLAQIGQSIPGSSSLTWCGGFLCGLAFFLPWFSISFNGASFSDNLLNILTKSGNQFNAIPGLWLGWIEPVAAVVLLIFPFCVGSLGRRAHTLDLIASLAGLGVLLYALVVLSSVSNVSPAAYLGVGFWLALLGFLISLAGAVEGRSGKPQATLFEDNSWLVFIGGGLSGLAFFLPWSGIFNLLNAVELGGKSSQGILDPVLLVLFEPIAAGSLLIFFLLRKRIGKAVYNWCLAGALLGLAFCVYLFVRAAVYVSSLQVADFSTQVTDFFLVLGIAVWIALPGFILGLMGSLMGRKETP